MKIAISGTSCIGKTTFINDFLKNWSNYTKPEKTYRNLIKEKNLKHSSKTTEETQVLILDFLAQQATQFSENDNVILDRCVLDALAYSTWLCLNDKLSEKLLDQQRILVRETLKLYDIIFFLPITKFSTITEVEDDGFRDTDPIFREEIDNIFKAFQESYHKGDGRIFPKDDSPAIIEIFGSPEERIKMVEFYLDKDGQPYGADQSLLDSVIPATQNDLNKIEADMFRG
jgi:predicted ATPase